jgi:tRNA1(Val) A37 N6-methylase TrmN6
VREDLQPGAGEDLCHLAGDWRIFQLCQGHRWSLDDLVTAWMAARVGVAGSLPGSLPGSILDLGCGIGSVLMLLAWRFPAARVVGLEAQPESAALARRSLAWNGADAPDVAPRCVVVEGDLRDPAALESRAAPFALITGTPPYFPRGEGVESDRPQRGPCRFEHRGGVEDYVAAAARHLAPDGAFVMCAGAAQSGRVKAAAQSHALGMESRLDVIPREGKAPLFSVFSFRNAPSSPQVAAQTAVVRNPHGRWTDWFKSVRAEFGMPT